MAEARRHVLIWVAPEFLTSSGMIQLFTEAGIFSLPGDDLDEYTRAAQGAGGFAMTGMLVNSSHGAGIWISPERFPELELLLPWPFVKSVVTAESPRSSQVFGLVVDAAQPNAITHGPESGASKHDA